MPTLQDFLDHPIKSLERALHLRKQIDTLQKQLADLFGSNPPALSAIQVFETKRRGRKKGSKMSAAARVRMAAGQRARWAKNKGAEVAAPSAPVLEAKKKKGGMSAAGRTRIAAAQKARWAKVKAGKSSAAAKAAPAPKKKKGGMSAAGRARITAAQKLR